MKLRTVLLVLVLPAILVTACGKGSTGKGQTCKCKGGLAGQGTTEVMDTFTHAEAEARCSNYNAIVGPDAYYDCHLE